MAIQIPVQKMDSKGAFLALAPAEMTGDGSDPIREMINDGNTIVFIKNDTLASATITLTAAPANDSGRAVDVVMTVAAGANLCLGKINRDNFNLSGKITLTLGSADAALLMYAFSSEGV